MVKAKNGHTFRLDLKKINTPYNNHCSFRGTMMTSLVLSECLVHLLQFNGIFTVHLSFAALPFIILLTVIAAVSIYFLPETPVFLVKENKFQVSRK